MTNKIKEMSWVEFKRRVEENPTVIIPTGAVEVYGPHMPLGTDIIVAEELAKRVALATGALIAPSVEMGESSSLMTFPGTMAVTMDSYKAYMEDVIKLLIHHGLKNFLFMNGHGGNTCIITYLCKKYQRSAGIKCAQVDVWQFIEKIGAGIFEFSGAMAHGHAAESNTSMMLYLRPELVDMTKAERVAPEAEPYPEITKYIEFNVKTPVGIIGDPTVATVEKGRRAVEEGAEKISAFVRDYFGVREA